MENQRLKVLRELTIEAAKEVTEAAAGQFPHLERLLGKMEEEIQREMEMWAMQLRFQECTNELQRDYWTRLQPIAEPAEPE